jgi:glycosyltransferase involved in cell wall biosynthesis
MKVLMVLQPIPNGIQHHRMLNPAVMLGQTPGFEVRHVADLGKTHVPIELAHWADVIIVSRLLSEYPQQQPKIIESLKSVKAKLVIDLDDYWILPNEHPLKPLWKAFGTAACIRETLSLADMVWTTNEHLASKIDNVTHAPVHVVENGISQYDTQWKDLGKKRPYSELMIGFSAAPSHYPDLKRLRKPLKALRAQRGWRLVAMGALPTDHAKIIDLLQCDRIRFEAPLPSTEYASMYSGIGLMLAPLAHTQFNRMRSDLKLAEAAHSNTPIMCENYGPYIDCPQSVKNWDKLAEVVIAKLTTQPNILDDYMVKYPEYYTTEEADKTRIDTLKELVGFSEMKIVK